MNRTGHPIAIPELEASGYRFMGGRVVAGTHGAAVLLMYDDDKGTRLVMLAQPMPKRDDSRMTAVAAGNVHGFVWSDGGFGYSLVGAAPPERLAASAGQCDTPANQGAYLNNTNKGCTCYVSTALKSSLYKE